MEVRDTDYFTQAFSQIVAVHPDALVTFSDSLTVQHRRQIVDFATSHQLPMISEVSVFAQMGALMTYGASMIANYRRAAHYVDRILNGANPGERPIERPLKFDLAINIKTAQAFGITIPPLILYQATEVIQ